MRYVSWKTLQLFDQENLRFRAALYRAGLTNLKTRGPRQRGYCAPERYERVLACLQSYGAEVDI